MITPVTVLSWTGRDSATLHYHGGLDGPGIVIAAQVITRHQARPWRLTAADYRAAVRTAHVHEHVHDFDRDLPRCRFGEGT